jgi:ABC-2 type transport system ATP-binding protein
MADSPLSAQHLSKWFGQVMAVHDLTFDCHGSVVGLLGPNGAGKSTLMKLLTGQLRPSQGEVRLQGEAPWGNRRLLSWLGYCPEHDRFYEDLTPLQFVIFLVSLCGYDPDQARTMAQDALKLVLLEEEKWHAPIRTLSHGMRQKLKVAQALAHRPKILILDEPLSGMDPVGRAQMISLFRQQAQQGVWLLISSHVLHELESMTSQILLLNHGRMVALGDLHRIRELIDAHPHRIALTCDRPRALGQALLSFEDVCRVEVQPEGLIVETRVPDACYDRIGELAAGGEFAIRSMVSLDDNMESVYRYLIR